MKDRLEALEKRLRRISECVANRDVSAAYSHAADLVACVAKDNISPDIYSLAVEYFAGEKP